MLFKFLENSNTSPDSLNVPDIEAEWQFPATDRIVAVGDVHGDVTALIGCMEIAGLIDDNQDWIGGTTHFVQIGDILDRGDEEKDCIDLLAKLRKQAKEAGGMVHVLIGNHEVMNVDLDFRYVTPGAWTDWDTRPKSGTLLVSMAEQLASIGFPPYMKQRVMAFRPGGSAAKELAKMRVAIQIGDTILVHGGLRLKHIEYGLDRLNKQTAAWLEGGSRYKNWMKPEILDDNDSPVWARLYSVPQPKARAQEELEAVLTALGGKRMVVGHTPQLRGVNSAVTPRGFEVWRTDTGMSQGMMSGPLECLEVLGDGTTHIITETGIVPAAMRSPEATGDVIDVCDVDTGICTPLPDEVEAIHFTQPSPPEEPGTLRVRVPEEAPVAGFSLENKLEVEVLREMDDATLALEDRISFLLERLIADAVRREDETLTKKTVKEMLRKVIGVEAVSEYEEYVAAEIRRIISMGAEAILERYAGPLPTQARK